ncbi:hypothetical protein B0H17DRAFT_1055474 [Mycena rosella]|uniref:Alpha/beta-hydrolase n=1 Tax=Mycena rosella TaxID=1033263 RepID=A0AAD7DPV4_MYCRO|nr:hypothetical protein B0H17DRAFT_1055474 [Mycena rosella]
MTCLRGTDWPNKTRNLRITTADGESLGAWFVLSDPFYHSLPAIPSQPTDHIPAALKIYPQFSSSTGTPPPRVYTGTPTEAGLARDARAAWNWLIANGATADQILIVGHSLGTGASALLTAKLSDEGITARGVVLLSPFSSLSKVLETCKILGVVPLLRPLAMIP